MAPNEVTKEDTELGVKAIIFLQGMVGITEPEDVARRNWLAMRGWERESTMKAYAMFTENKA